MESLSERGRGRAGPTVRPRRGRASAQPGPPGRPALGRRGAAWPWQGPNSGRGPRRPPVWAPKDFRPPAGAPARPRPSRPTNRWTVRHGRSVGPRPTVNDRRPNCSSVRLAARPKIYLNHGVNECANMLQTRDASQSVWTLGAPQYSKYFCTKSTRMSKGRLLKPVHLLELFHEHVFPWADTHGPSN